LKIVLAASREFQGDYQNKLLNFYQHAGAGQSRNTESTTVENCPSHDDLLQIALVDFVKMLLSGACDIDINAVIFGGKVIAHSKKRRWSRRFQWAI